MRSVIPCIALLMVSFATIACQPVWGQTCTDPSDLVVVEDVNLKAAVRQQLGKAAGDEITCAELEALQQLLARKKTIKSLEGLEHASQLERLDLRNNGISDLGPLERLTKVEKLDLGKNDVRDISILRALKKVKVLELDRNGIEDITPLLQNDSVGRGVRIDISRNCLDLSEGSDDLDAIRVLEMRKVDLIYEPQRQCPGL